MLNAQQNQAALNMRDLEVEIRRIVSETMQEQARGIVQNIINPAVQNEQDQIIEPQHRAQLGELDRVPDVVRCLREFSGQPGEFSSWRKSVERILDIYKNLRGTAKYFGILSVVRNKIVGHADAILESYNTPLNWESISRCLTLHYADKRDVSTLEYQLTSLIQGTESVQEFYQKVYNHLSLILNKISCMDIGQESLHLLTQTYRDKALDTFIRGLKGDLPRLLAMKEPTDLPKALHLCLKLENQNYRTNYAQNIKSKQNFRPVPPRNNHVVTPNRFYPELAHIPPPPRPQRPSDQFHRQQPVQTYRNNNYQNQGAYPKYTQYNNPPPRPFVQKPPEPMDIDQSIRTHNINYMNKPVNNGLYGKRPPPQHPEARKQARNFHLQAEANNATEKQDIDDIDRYLNQVQVEDEAYEQTLYDYMDGERYEKTNYNPDNIDEIHFLD